MDECFIGTYVVKFRSQTHLRCDYYFFFSCIFPSYRHGLGYDGLLYVGQSIIPHFAAVTAFSNCSCWLSPGCVHAEFCLNRVCEGAAGFLEMFWPHFLLQTKLSKLKRVYYVQAGSLRYLS